MNGRKYIMQQKLKKDTEIFNKKLNLSKNIDFFTTQIKNFSEQQLQTMIINYLIIRILVAIKIILNYY